jgi:hypothetical protein
MDHKALKSDMTYAIKKMIKEGKTITHESLANNLSLVDGKFILTVDTVDVLEAFVLVKGFSCTKEKATYNLPLVDLICEQGQIAKSDIYDFMDGLENVAGNDKSEFYKAGVYIREKFAPVGTRVATLQKVKYQEVELDFELVRAFVVHSRPMPGCRKTGVPSIVEVECEVSHPPLCEAGAFVARINKPESLWEPTRTLQDGVLKNVMSPPIYSSHAIYLSIKDARFAAEKTIKSSLDFDVRKGRISSYTEEELKSKLAEIQTIMLP